MNSDTKNNCILIQSKETNNELGLHNFRKKINKKKLNLKTGTDSNNVIYSMITFSV